MTCHESVGRQEAIHILYNLDIHAYNTGVLINSVQIKYFRV